MIEPIMRAGLVGLARVLVGARPQWQTAVPAKQTLYFANHSSHLDALVIWSALPPYVRTRTRPVAARDYWAKPGVRTYAANRVLRAVMIDRKREDAEVDPLVPVMEALSSGDSLILFPEGTRTAERLPGTFRTGLFRLAEAFPDVQLVPVYLDTLHRSMPKGSVVPLPLYCTVRFGAPLARVQGETRDSFLQRAREAVVALA